MGAFNQEKLGPSLLRDCEIFAKVRLKLYYPHCQVLEREVLRGVAAGVGEELRGVALINTNHLPHSCPNDTKLAYVSVPHRIALATHEDEATRRGPGGVVVPGYLHIYNISTHIYTYLHISTHISTHYC